uniref:Uncharacterized protein n=1 Tax=Anguilla anguilla TaxID=7936 RepID=A0A0E9TVQ3_ANGAN
MDVLIIVGWVSWCQLTSHKGLIAHQSVAVTSGDCWEGAQKWGGW